MSAIAPCTVLEAGPGSLADIAALAGVIWRAHYPGIITPAQIGYMLDRMYDLEVMRREMAEGVVYLAAVAENAMRGFAACGPGTAPGEAKLHKLYVHPDWQRCGIGRALLSRCQEVARDFGATRLVLNVNKRNTNAIAAYQKHGFAIRDSVIVDIGSGFVMDDYVMERTI